MATRRRGGDKVQTRDVLFDQALPDKADAHLSYIEHRDRIRKSFLCPCDEMGKFLRRVVYICCQVPANPNILDGFERHYEREQNYKNLRKPSRIKNVRLI